MDIESHRLMFHSRRASDFVGYFNPGNPWDL